MAESHEHYWTWYRPQRVWRCACGAIGTGCPACAGTGHQVLARLDGKPIWSDDHCDPCGSSGIVLHLNN